MQDHITADELAKSIVEAERMLELHQERRVSACVCVHMCLCRCKHLKSTCKMVLMPLLQMYRCVHVCTILIYYYI